MKNTTTNMKIRRRKFIKQCSEIGMGISIGATIFSGSNCKNSIQRIKANIILIVADDIGYSDLGCYGGEAQTPNLDKLAQSGISFTRFYKAAKCFPTRASLLTCLYAHQTGMGHKYAHVTDPYPEDGLYQGYLNDHCVTISEVLKQNGYRTYMSGKWHLGAKKAYWPKQRGFDRYFGLIRCSWSKVSSNISWKADNPPRRKKSGSDF